MKKKVYLTEFTCIDNQVLKSKMKYLGVKLINVSDKWVPVTMAWRVLRMRMEERPRIWKVTANILNKQVRTADKVWSYSSGIGRDANNSSPNKRNMLPNINWCLGTGLILCHIHDWIELVQDRDSLRALCE
jgi:hypothetical protein